MVFESVITEMMNRFLGDFIEDLDGKQLNIGIWGGDVVLKNLKLKQDALKDLDLPVQTVYGQLGTLVLKIPWKNLYSMPVVVTIEDLYLLVAPNAAVQYSADKEAAAELAAKRAELDKLEELRKRELNKDSPTTAAADKTFTERLIAQIINNVQIRITNVHIRYEDRSTSTVPFAFGITLGSLQVHTTDADWKETFLAEALSKVFKVAKLDGLAVYMNCNTTMVQSLAVDRWNGVLLETIARQNVRPEGYAYVLGPINALAKLKLNMNPELDVPAFVTPKVDLSLEMQTLAVGITRAQYQRLIEVADGFGAMTRGLPYRKWRPHNIPVHGNARQWWRFAFNCIVETSIRRRKREWSWSHILAHRNTCRSYALAYEKRVCSRKAVKELVESCERLETQMDLFSLKLIRQTVDWELERSGALRVQEPVSSSWFGGWWGGKSDEPAKAGATDYKKQIKSAMTAEEKEKLFNAIGYIESEGISELPKDYVAVTAHFKLNQLEVFIRNESEAQKDATFVSTVMSFQVNDVSCGVEQRPASSGLALDLRLTEFTILGHENAGNVPTMVKSRLEESDGCLLRVHVELNPLDGLCDQRVRVSARPLEIIYDAPTVIELLKIFKLPRDSYLAELGDAASVQLAGIKERSATGIQYMVEKRSRLDVNISVMPNYLVIPHGGVYTENETSVLVLCLGALTLKTLQQTDRRDVAALYAAGLSAHDVMRLVREQAYDKYSLEVQNIQLLVAVAGENWKACLNDDHITDMHILEPMSLIVNADICVVADDPQLPKTRLSAQIPRIGLAISDDRTLCAAALAASIPLPESDDDLAPRPLSKENTGLMTSSMSLKKFLGEGGAAAAKQRGKAKAAAAAASKAPVDPSGELVQFTDLDFQFVMHELCLRFYRVGDRAQQQTPSEHSSSRTPPEEYADALSQLDAALLGTAATLEPRPSVTSSSGGGGGEPQLSGRHIAIRVRQLELAMVQRTYDMRVSLKLGAIGVNQLRPDDPVLKDLAFIETPTYQNETGHLFTCVYTSANKTCPEFTTQYKSVEQLIEIHFSVLLVRLHQERLSEMMLLAYDLRNSYEEMTRAATPSGGTSAASPGLTPTRDRRDRIGNAGDSLAATALATIAEEVISTTSGRHTVSFAAGAKGSSAAGGAASAAAAGRRSHRATPVDSVQLKLVAHMERVAVVLECNRRAIAELKVEKLTAGVVIKKSYTDVTLRLQDIMVSDPNPATVHRGIMRVIGGNALVAQVVMYNLAETSNYNSDNMRIDVQMGCVKMVFLNWFVTSVLGFLDHFQEAQLALADASAAAAEQARENMLQAYENAQRMRLNIRIKAPIILVPVDSRSLEAIAIDFGDLAITNLCSEVAGSEREHGPAILDEMKVELRDLMLSRVRMVKEGADAEEEEGEQELEAAGQTEVARKRLATAGLRSSVDILSPTTFALLVRRNLSAGWYRQIPDLDVSARLKSIVLNMQHDDAQLVQLILAKNMVEGAEERLVMRAPTPPRKQSVSVRSAKPSDGESDSTTVTAAQVHNERASPATQAQNPDSMHALRKKLPTNAFEDILPLAGPKHVTDTFLKFTFQMDSIVLNLNTARDVGLASFGIYYLSLKGYQLVDKSLFASIVLCDMQLDDCRPNRENMITKFMQKKSLVEEKAAQRPQFSGESAAATADEDKPETTMLDIVVRMTSEEMFVNLKVCSFDLILSLEFLMQLLQFMSMPEEKAADDASKVPAVVAVTAPAVGTASPTTAAATAASTLATASVASAAGTVAAEQGKKITVIMKIEQPDIILVEQMDNINCLALILTTQVELRARIHEQRQIISGEIADFKMFVCEFNPLRRGQTKHYVLHPCNLTLHAATPESTGMNISLTASDIRINITPGTIDLLNKAMTTFTSSGTVAGAEAPEVDNSDLWAARRFTEQSKWYMKVDGAEDAMSALSLEPEPLPEVCIVCMPSIVIVVETGFGYYTYPMLHLKSRLNAEIRDWSSDMIISSSLSLGMSYYNSEMAVWEPIIEPNERVQLNGLVELVPWELSFNLNIDRNPDETSEEAEPKTKIHIASSEALEMTVTKSCLDVLQDLGVAFSTALSQEGLQRPENVAPYVVINDTGFEVTVTLRDSPLFVHRTQPHIHDGSVNIAAAVAEATAADEQLRLAPGARAMLQCVQTGQSMQSLSASLTQSDELFLNVRIGNIAKDVALPIHKADRRYFPLYRDTKQEPWGIISHVKTEYGSTLITLHGVLQIENHFSTELLVWRRRTAGQMLRVGEIAPGQVFNVPLHALYAERKELFFSLRGYKTSVQGINWTERPSDYKFAKLLQCDPEETFEPFYVMAIRERHEIYHEISSKHTMLSAYYVFHLHPPLYVRNALPVSLFVSVAGCSVAAEPVEAGAEAAEAAAAEAAAVSEESLAAMAGAEVSGVSAAGAGKCGQQVDFLDYGEKEVRPGDILHLPTVKTTVKEGENRSYIVARIVNYLDRDWSCTTEIPSDPAEFAVWVFNSYDSVSKMTLDLGVKFDTTAGNLQLVVYCPYWMINKTGLMLSYRASDESVNVLYHPPDHNGPILFSFREKHFFGKKQAALRVESGTWSTKFALDAAGSTGKVDCKHDRHTYQIAVNSTLTSNSLTKQIVFTPFFVIINKAPFAVEVQEDQRPGDPWLRAEPHSCIPLWPRVTHDPMLRVKTADEVHASVPFRYVTVQTTLLRLANKYGGINVDVQLAEGGTYIVFSEYHPGDAPALIVNHTGRDVVFWERGNVNERRLAAGHQQMYTWSDPTGARTIYWDAKDKLAESDLRRDGLNEYRAGVSEDGEEVGAAAAVAEKGYWVSFLDGTQRVLLFTNSLSIAQGANSASRLDQVSQEIEVEIHGMGVSLVNNAKMVDIMYIGMASSNVIWEELKRKRYYKPLSIAEVGQLEEHYQDYLRQRQVGAEEGNQFGLDDGSVVEITEEAVLWRKASGVKTIRRTFYPGLWVNIKSSPYQLQLHAKINRIQIDNQLVDCIFPVVLAPVPPPKSVAASTGHRRYANLFEEYRAYKKQRPVRFTCRKELKPFIECSIVQRVIPYSSVKQFKYLTVLIQEFHVKVDMLFINAIVEMVSPEQDEDAALKLFHADLARQQEPLSALALSHSSQEQKNFYDELHLGPLKIHISFSMAGLETTALPGVMSTILQGVGVTLTDVNDIVFRLAFFERNYQFFTQAQLTSEVTSHYAGLALKQAYVLILGLDVIGNPYGLVVGITKGVEDLFYEPFQGAIQGPGEFAEGLVLGVRSLFGHTVGGAAGAVSKITGAMGKGLAVLTFDKAYQQKRRKQLNKKPANLQEGLARSGKGLVMGVYDGVTGVFTKPISGAKSEGVEGFFKGLGKGAVGLVARPTAGLVDFASGSFEAVKRATELSDEVTRLRARRLMHADGVVRPFSVREAEGNKLLKEVDKGKYANSDQYIDYHSLPKRVQLLLTDQRLLYCVKNDLFGGWQAEWTHRWSEIHHVRIVERGIELLLVEKNRKVLGLFGSSEQAKKVILMARNVRQQQLVDEMQSQVRMAQQASH